MHNKILLCNIFSSILSFSLKDCLLQEKEYESLSVCERLKCIFIVVKSDATIASGCGTYAVNYMGTHNLRFGSAFNSAFCPEENDD